MFLMHLFHVVMPDDWAKFKKKDYYEAESLHTEGFIHLSYPHQLEGVLLRYYSGVKKVIILEIDPELLTAELKDEVATGGELFPHLYGALNKSAIVGVEEGLL